MLNWRRISTVEVPGLTEKFKSMRISPLTSKYYKKRVRHFRLTSQTSFSFCWLGVMRMRFSLRALYHLNHLNSSIHLGALTDKNLALPPATWIWYWVLRANFSFYPRPKLGYTCFVVLIYKGIFFFCFFENIGVKTQPCVHELQSHTS